MSSPHAQAQERSRRVLVVDDDDQARRGFCTTLTDAGYEVAEAWSVVQAMRMLLSLRPHAVVLDLILPDGDGSDVGRAMGAIVTTRGTCVVAVTGSATTDASADPASFGASRILVKPVDRDTLLAAIEECFGPPPADTPPAAAPELASP